MRRPMVPQPRGRWSILSQACAEQASRPPARRYGTARSYGSAGPRSVLNQPAEARDVANGITIRSGKCNMTFVVTSRSAARPAAVADGTQRRLRKGIIAADCGPAPKVAFRRSRRFSRTTDFPKQFASEGGAPLLHVLLHPRLRRSVRLVGARAAKVGFSAAPEAKQDRRFRFRDHLAV